MAFAVTTEVRTHTLGDLRLVTGTFTDGGTEVELAGRLSSVIACGAHATSVQGTGVFIDNVAGEVAGETALTVDAVAAGINDCRNALRLGQTIYNAAGVRSGVVTALAATTVTVADGIVGAFADDEEIHIMGSVHMGRGTLIEGTPNNTARRTSLVTASHDATNNFLIICAGSGDAVETDSNNASSVPTMDGTWWALGER